MKLSPARRRVLERLAAGETINVWFGKNHRGLWQVFARWDDYFEPVHNKVLDALIHQGLIDFVFDDIKGNRVYTITDKGRAALEASA